MCLKIDLLIFVNELSFELLVQIVSCENHGGIMITSFASSLVPP